MRIPFDEYPLMSQDWTIIGTCALVLFVLVVWSVVILTILEKYDDKG